LDNPAKTHGWVQKFTTPSVLMTIALVWLSAEFVILGKFSFIYTGDNATSLIPGLLSLKFAGSINPLWSNYSAAGWDQIGVNPQGLVNRYLFLELPGWLAYQINILTQIFAAFFGTYWLGRRVLGFTQLASLFAAFMFASGVTGQIFIASAYLLPAVLVTLTRVLDGKTRAVNWLCLIAALFILSHTAWISMMLPFTSAAIVTWFLFIDQRRKISDWLIIFLCAAAVILMRAPDILALMQQSTFSHRKTLMLSPDIAQWPWAFKGSENLVSLALLAYAFIVRKTASRQMWGIVFAVSFWLILPYGIALFHEPLISVFPSIASYSYFERISRVPTLILMMAGGYGLQALVSGGGAEHSTNWLRKSLLVATSVAVLIIALDQKKNVFSDWITQGNMVNNYESPALQNLAKKIQAETWPMRVEPFQMYPAYLHTYGMETAGGLHALFSSRYYEFWSTIVEPWIMQRQGETQDFGKTSPKLLEKTGDWPMFRGPILMLTADDHKPERRIGEMFRLNLLSLANVGYLVSRDRLVDTSLEPVLESPVSWSSLSSWQKVRQNLLGNFRGRENLYIYRNRDVLPRFFAASGIRRFADKRAVLEAMAGASTQELRTTLFVESGQGPAGQDLSRTFNPATVRLDEYKSDEIRLTVDGRGPTLLFAGNSYSPFWKARVDGKPVPIFPADHAFWGVILPEGAKTVVFSYEPPYANLPQD